MKVVLVSAGVALAGLIALLVVVLGGGGGSAHHSQRRDMSHVDDPATIGKVVGCGSRMSVKLETYAQQEMICHAGGKEVSIARFENRETVVQFAKLASGFGANCAVVNNHWEVCSTYRPLMMRVAKANGWKLA
jgi:hypothetical protein